MSNSIFSHIPDPEYLLALEPEELAAYFMEYLNALPVNERWKIHPHNIVSSLPTLSGNWPPQYRDKIPEFSPRIARALMEAWTWLVREGLIASDPGEGQHGWYFITRRGERLKKVSDVQAYRRANLLPKDLLHPLITERVQSAFLRGEYDVAVFQAFREVEIAVREVAGYAATDHGVPMMRRAFNPKAGPLTDQNNPDEGEREALASLFAGAIGSYKNPQSHRREDIKADEAVEMIMLANHLLRIVDSRRYAPIRAPQ